MGIIGGADGPTLFFVSSPLTVVIGAAGIAAAVGVLVALIIRAKKKHRREQSPGKHAR